MTQVLVLPGIFNSGPGHWQSRWEALHPEFRRVVQSDWDRPDCRAWVERLEGVVASSGPDTVLVAHSLGCLTVAHWAAASIHRIRGAMLVAAPDPAGSAFPPEARGFAPVPLQPLPFSSILVASTDDPYGGVEYAQRCGSAWGSEVVVAGALGHINAVSGLGDWPTGYELLRKLIEA